MRLTSIAFILAAFSSLAFSAPSSAVSTSRSSMKYEAPKSGSTTEGLRVSIFKPNYDMKISVTAVNNLGNQFSGSTTMDLDGGNGLFVGYAYLPVRSVGYIAGLNYIEIVSNDTSANTVRADINGTYAFNSNFYAKAGLNTTRWVSKGASRIDGSIGKQIGLGMQVTKNIGLDITYSEARVSQASKDAFMKSDMTADLVGTEFGITGTF